MYVEQFVFLQTTELIYVPGNHKQNIDSMDT